MKAHIKKILAVLCFIFPLGSTAQTTAGITAGAGYGNIYIGQNEFYSSNITGLETGLFVNFQSAKFYFRPQALYMYRSGQGNSETPTDLSYHRLQFPLIFGYKLIGPIAIEGGPAYNRTLQINHRMGSSVLIHRNGYGYRIGPSLQFSRAMLYMHYEGLVISSGTGHELIEPFRLNFGLGITLGSNRKIATPK